MKTISLILTFLTMNIIYGFEDSTVYDFESIGEVTFKIKMTQKEPPRKKLAKDKKFIYIPGTIKLGEYTLTDEHNKLIWKKEYTFNSALVRAAGSLPHFKVYSIQSIESKVLIVYNVDKDLYIEVMEYRNHCWKTFEIINLSSYFKRDITFCEPKIDNNNLKLYLLGSEPSEMIVSISLKTGNIRLSSNLDQINICANKQQPKSPTTNKVLEQGNKGESKQLKLLWLACIVLTISLIIQHRKAHKVSK